MVYQVDRIKEDVRICIDQNRSSEQLVADSDLDMLTLEDVVESKIVDAVDEVHLAAPYWMLEQGHNFNLDYDDLDDDEEHYANSIHWGDKESGWVLLPEDYLRLVVFEMSDWERPVYEPVSTLSAEYKRQRNRVKALRGTAQRPVCAVVTRPEGLSLEFYSCKSEDAEITKAVYIPKAKVDADGGVDISERCYKAVVYTIAGMFMVSCGETERAKAFLDIAKTLLQ